MVFSVEDTGVAAPAAGVDAPPSEGLANALRLYQRERYAESAVLLQRVVSGATTDSPANLEKAHFFLAKSLFHLGYHRAALSLFDEITQRGAAHRFFEPTLPWLAQLATQLPEPAGIVELVGRYDTEQLASLDTAESSEVHDHLLYLAGRHAYAQADLELAIERFASISEASSHHAHAAFLMGVTQVRARRARPAIEAFRRALSAIDHGNAPEPERLRALVWLSLARVYYTAANRTDPETGERTLDTTLLANAIEAWDRVDPSSVYWLDALFEQSWALFLSHRENHAMGNIHALFSPYFQDAYYPEALILKAVVFFSACQTRNAQAMVHQFHDRYDPVREELMGTLAGFADSEQLFRFLGDALAGRAALSPRIQGPVVTALSDRTITRNLEYVQLLDRESERLEASDEAFRTSGIGDRIRQELSVSRSFAVDHTGELARGRFTRLIDDLDELMNQMDTVEVEMIRTIREGLSTERADEQERVRAAGGLNVEVDEEHQIWPFDGEYWRDELPFYRQRVSSICGR